jgi:hypothetical protein
MPLINSHIQAELRSKNVDVFFVSGAATKWWNAKRKDKKTEICLLGGWYWTLGTEEAGPFRTPSAAWRDVYYRRVINQKPPVMNQRDLAKAEKDIAKAAKQDTKPAARNSVRDGVVRLRA